MTPRQGDAETRGCGDGKTQTLGPADKVVIAYLAVIACLIAIFSGRVLLWWMLLPAHALTIACVFLIARLANSAASSPAVPGPGLFLRFTRSWYPAVLIPFTYKELEYLIPRLHPHDFDVELAALDRWMFAVDPTLWLERLTWPPLTELLQLSYITYYFLPLVLGGVLWRKRWFDEFDFVLFVLVLGFYLAYLGYIAVPALGPRFLPEIQNAQTKPLTGLVLFDAIHRTLNRLEGITRDCFPSGHTEVTLLVLCYAWRLHRRTFWWLLTPGSLLIVATVYLRYHYVIDVAAGATLALAIMVVARPLYRCLGGRLGQNGRRRDFSYRDRKSNR